MSGTYKSKAELVAIYRLEFYRKQKHWKFCSDVRREQPDNRDKASMKNSLNETYDVDLTDVGEAGDGGEGGDPGGSQSELNKAFVDSGPDEQSPPPESRPNTPQSWLEHDPNQTQDTSPTHPDRIPTPPPYPPPKQLPRDIPEVWPQPVTWESHQYNRDNQDLRDKCPELNRSYTKVDWMDSEKIYPEEMYPEKYSGLKDWQEEWQPQPWAECGATWGEPVWGETGWPEVGGELPELDRGAGGGGEDTWPLMGWDVPGVTDAVWSDDVARELAALAAPLQPPGPADTSADCSPDTSCDSAVVLFTRGAHCAPHSSELDLHAQLDATDGAGPALWRQPRRALEARGRRLARALRRVAAELRARDCVARARDTQQSDVSGAADIEPTRDVGLWGPPGDTLLAGSHRALRHLHLREDGRDAGTRGGDTGDYGGNTGTTGGNLISDMLRGGSRGSLSGGHIPHIGDIGSSDCHNRGDQLMGDMMISQRGYAGLGRGHQHVEAPHVPPGRGRGRLPRAALAVANRPLPH